MSVFPKAYADLVQRLRVTAGFVIVAAFAWLSQPTLHYLAFLLPVSALGLLLPTAARRWVLAALFAAVFLLIYLPAIELEEQHLRQLFPNFAAYSERIPALW